MNLATPDRTDAGLAWTRGGVARMSEDTRACRACPVPGCTERFLSADAAGRHLDRWHDEKGRWRANRLKAVEQVGQDSLTLVDATDGTRWILSDTFVDLREMRNDEPPEVRR